MGFGNNQTTVELRKSFFSNYNHSKVRFFGKGRATKANMANPDAYKAVENAWLRTEDVTDKEPDFYGSLVSFENTKRKYKSYKDGSLQANATAMFNQGVENGSITSESKENMAKYVNTTPYMTKSGVQKQTFLTGMASQISGTIVNLYMFKDKPNKKMIDKVRIDMIDNANGECMHITIPIMNSTRIIFDAILSASVEDLIGKKLQVYSRIVGKSGSERITHAVKLDGEKLLPMYEVTEWNDNKPTNVSKAKDKDKYLGYFQEVLEGSPNNMNKFFATKITKLGVDIRKAIEDGKSPILADHEPTFESYTLQPSNITFEQEHWKLNVKSLEPDTLPTTASKDVESTPVSDTGASDAVASADDADDLPF